MKLTNRENYEYFHRVYVRELAQLDQVEMELGRYFHHAFYLARHEGMEAIELVEDDLGPEKFVDLIHLMAKFYFQYDLAIHKGAGNRDQYAEDEEPGL